MNEPVPPSPAPGGGLSEKNLALIAYILHLLGPLTVYLLNIAAVVINYVKRDEVSPELASHHRWMIHTFWWGLFWGVLSVITFIIGVGVIIYVVLAIWWIYRHVRGLLALSDNKPLPV